MALSKILVIENSRNLRTFYKMELERDGHRVVTAADAGEGVRLLESESPDLVVLDVPGPGVAVRDALRRTLSRCATVPVVLNSGHAGQDVDVLGRGADAYVIKSADTDELRATIRWLLERSREIDGGSEAA